MFYRCSIARQNVRGCLRKRVGIRCPAKHGQKGVADVVGKGAELLRCVHACRCRACSPSSRQRSGSPGSGGEGKSRCRRAQRRPSPISDSRVSDHSVQDRLPTGKFTPSESSAAGEQATSSRTSESFRKIGAPSASRLLDRLRALKERLSAPEEKQAQAGSLACGRMFPGQRQIAAGPSFC